jgi:hypothetical protein
MNESTVYVMLAGSWIVAEWDACHVGCYIGGAWFNLATFEAYSFE